ncbi:MAG: SGNH/GDSL hydrolase family protein [Leptospiraceae bacterium]|nr:SGNH/GDSL hydrolase family protein [Leptospiraceae bacterium]
MQLTWSGARLTQGACELVVTRARGGGCLEPVTITETGLLWLTISPPEAAYQPGMHQSRQKCLRVLSLLLYTVWLGHCADRERLGGDLLALMQNGQQNRHLLVLGDSLTEYSRAFTLPERLAGSWQVHWLGAPNRDVPWWTLHLDEGLSLPGRPFDLVLFVMGTNDAYSYSTDRYLSQMQDFHSALRLRSSAAVIYCQVPRSRDVALQPRILAQNAALPAWLPVDAAPLLDLDTPMETAVSGPDALYPLTDPIHPNAAGYDVLGRAMQVRILGGAF